MGSKINKEDFEKIVKESYCVKECLEKMGLKPEGGNYQTFYYYVNKYNADINHFDSAKFLSNNLIYGKTYPIDYYLNNKVSTIKSSYLLKRLINEGYKQEECEICGIKMWNNKKIHFQLHHIDGNHYNNSIENLQVLCPNCHSQTDTYCGKNAKHKKKEYFCSECGCHIGKKTKNGLCLKCEHKKFFKCEHPDKETLIKLLKETNFLKVGKKYGVSDNAVRKWCRQYGISDKSKDYKYLLL